MTIQYAVDVNNGRLDAIESTIGTAPVLELWNGTKPANCAASDTGTKIANGTLPSDWMAAASSAAKAKSGSWSVTGLSAAGTGMSADYFRLTVGGACKMQGSITATGGGGDVTMDNTSVANGQVVTVNSFSINAGNQ